MTAQKDLTVTEVSAPTSGSSLKAPLFASRPAAGFPAPGDDLVEKALDINDLVVKHPAATFFVRVKETQWKESVSILVMCWW
ncbi:MAG: hypothetical protein R3B69_00250 [Candidatus Paceibacterota bacterium]